MLQICDYPPCEGGGLEIYLFQESARLARLGYSVTIATSRFSSETYKSLLQTGSEVSGVKVIKVKESQELKDLILQSGIVQIHFTFSFRPLSVAALEICNSLKRPCLFSFHTTLSHVPFSNVADRSREDRKSLFGTLTMNLESENVKIILKSESSRETIKALGIRNEPKVVPYSVFGDIDNNQGSELGMAVEKVDLTYTGEVSLLKGINYLLDSVRVSRKILPHLKLRIIGGGSHVRDMQGLAEFWGLEENVEFTGYVEHKLIKSYLEKTRIYVQPSLSESLCISAAEALYLGVPVIATDTDGLIDLTDKGRYAHLVPKGDSMELANQVSRYLSNPQEYKDLKEKAEKGRTKIREKYSVEKQANRIDLICKKMLK